MRPILKSSLIVVVLCMTITVSFAMGEKPQSFSAYVDSRGAISLPADFSTTWVHLGTWVVTSQAATGMGLGQTDHGTGIHIVYAQPESLKAYKKNGTWPDGSMLVMEVRSLTWDDLPTGHVIAEGEPIKWFVMVKDTKGRFPESSNWGDGWGWALFMPASSKRNISTDYSKDCLGCHEVAKATDYVFIQGYPILGK